MRIIKLSQWAKENGYTYRGAYNRYYLGKIKGAFLSETNRVMVEVADNTPSPPKKTVTYARVSSNKQKDDLVRQSERLAQFCMASGIVVDQSFREIASGLNDDRPTLNKIMSDPEIGTIVVEHKDRLTRFGFNYLDKFSNKTIIVANRAHEDRDELMQDLISVITSMVARYYGKRRSDNIKKKIIGALE